MGKLLQRLREWWRLRSCRLCGNTSESSTIVFVNRMGRYRLCSDDLACKRRARSRVKVEA